MVNISRNIYFWRMSQFQLAVVLDWAAIKLSLGKETVSGTVRPKSTCPHPSAHLWTNIWPQIWTLMHFCRDRAPSLSWKSTNMVNLVNRNASMWKAVFSYSLYCYSTQLEVSSALYPMSNVFTCDLPKGQRNLFAEMASGGTAGGHGELCPLIKPTELKAPTSFISPTPKVAFGATGNSWTPGFLAYATFSEWD